MTQQNSHGNQIQDIPQTGFFGHPRGLGVLFFVEFWERFSYYGMRALLIFYMYFAVTDNGLGIDKTTAMSIMSVYGSLIYRHQYQVDGLLTELQALEALLY